MKLHKKFPTYRDGTLWLHEHGYSAVVEYDDFGGPCTVTLEGADAIRAAEQETNAKVAERDMSACRYLNLEEDAA